MSTGSETYSLICPKCDATNPYPLRADRMRHKLKCPKCSTGFTVRLVEVRRKSTTPSANGKQRAFLLQVRDLGPEPEEGVINFTNTSAADFDMRSRDIATLAYLGDDVKVVQDHTLGTSLKVTAPQCYLATYAYGADSPEVAFLRRFRDETLWPHAATAWLVRLYYTLSPWAVRHLGPAPAFRRLTRALVGRVLRALQAR